MNVKNVETRVEILAKASLLDRFFKAFIGGGEHPGIDKDVYAKWLGVGLRHADRALTLKPNDPDGLELRGVLRYWRYLINLEPDQSAATKLVASAEQDLRGAVNGNLLELMAYMFFGGMAGIIAIRRGDRAVLGVGRQPSPARSRSRPRRWRGCRRNRSVPGRLARAAASGGRVADRPARISE